MKSNKPYLLRALYDWIVDSDCTPHLAVDARYPGTCVPEAYVQDSEIVLNVAPSAVREWDMTDDAIRFKARFAGQPYTVVLPMGGIAGIYARENGQGMAFVVDTPPDGGPDDDTPGDGSRSHLKVVK